MAGQIASLPLSIQLDDNARPLSGCLLYLYAAGTSTPAVFYEDFTTLVVLSWPLVANNAGRLPNFWVTDGSYRVRLTDSAGNEIFDINSITAVGPSSGTTGGGTGVSNDQIFQTGDSLWIPVNTTRTGWVRGNALTIGSSSSGATERANADCQALFQFLWANFSDSICPVTGGRGGTSLADWNANKRIATLDMRGRTGYGLDTMGNSAASRLPVGEYPGSQTAGGDVGNPNWTLTQGNLPNVNFTVSGTAATHSHAAGSYAVGSHTHGNGTFALTSGTLSIAVANGTTVARGLSVNNTSRDASGATTVVQSLNFTSDTITASGTVGTGVSGTSGSTQPTFSGNSAASGALALTATAASGGTGTSLDTVGPGRIGTWFLKL